MAIERIAEHHYPSRFEIPHHEFRTALISEHPQVHMLQDLINVVPLDTPPSVPKQFRTESRRAQLKTALEICFPRTSGIAVWNTSVGYHATFPDSTGTEHRFDIAESEPNILDIHAERVRVTGEFASALTLFAHTISLSDDQWQTLMDVAVSGEGGAEPTDILWLKLVEGSKFDAVRTAPSVVS